MRSLIEGLTSNNDIIQHGIDTKIPAIAAAFVKFKEPEEL
jgi:hypothetical protein